MPNKKGSALLMVWVEVPADKEDDFNAWYNEEHLAERLAIPGFLSAARYESDSPGAPKHLAMYELENIGVMTSEAYLSVRAQPDRVDEALLAGCDRHDLHPKHLRADFPR